MYRQDNAHDDAIWSVSWAKGETDQIDHIVTGSLDDTVKAWKWFVMNHIMNAIILYDML